MSTPDGKARAGRFSRGLDPVAAALNASIAFDRRLARFDVAQSQAHARMLAAQGLIPADEVEALLAALEQVGREFAEGRIALRPELEDVHMHVEARLAELVGDAGRRLQTGRSRNDQVATDLRLYVRDACADLRARAGALRRALLARAQETVDVLLPGLTHLQHAQPVRLAHHLLAYVEMLGRDRARLRDCAARAGESPLGSGALAATGLPIDREATARALGFPRLTRNSLDAVSDRDFAAECAFCCALLLTHLSRLGEEVCLWATPEFGFVRLPESHASGSSLMPQKLNPDVAELLRAKPGRVAGDLVTLLTVLKGLPLSYNKDLQETQEPLYDAVETAATCLDAARGLVENLEFSAERMRAQVQDDFLCATDLADHLVARGVPFRRAHQAVGALVRAALARGTTLAALSDDDWRAAAPELDAGARALLHPERVVERRDHVGGPARARVLAELARLAAEPDEG